MLVEPFDRRANLTLEFTTLSLRSTPFTANFHPYGENTRPLDDPKSISRFAKDICMRCGNRFANYFTLGLFDDNDNNRARWVIEV